jgi:hypothetical protein
MATRTVFCVQVYGWAGERLVRLRLHEFGAREDALAKAEALKGRVQALVAFSVSGEPDFGSWEEPAILAHYGFGAAGPDMSATAA